MTNSTDIDSHHCDLCPRPRVYVTLDNSKDFMGDDAKLKMMTSAIQKLIDLTPSSTPFEIQSFSHRVQTVVTYKGGKGQDIETKLLDELGQIQKSDDGTVTRLYDGCVETLRDIPIKSLKNDRIFILIVSGSRDVGSSETLDSVIDLVNDMMGGDKKNENICLVFIHAGNSFKGLQQLEEKCWFKKFHVLKVPDSTHKIPSAFKKAEELFKNHYTRPFPCPAILKEVPDEEVNPVIEQCPDTGVRRRRLKSESGVRFKIVVWNIPLNSRVSDITTKFAEFGQCRLEKKGFERNFLGPRNFWATSQWQWCILSYDTMDGMSSACSQNRRMAVGSNSLQISRLSQTEHEELIEKSKWLKFPKISLRWVFFLGMSAMIYYFCMNNRYKLYTSIMMMWSPASTSLDEMVDFANPTQILMRGGGGGRR